MGFVLTSTTMHNELSNSRHYGFFFQNIRQSIINTKMSACGEGKRLCSFTKMVIHQHEHLSCQGLGQGHHLKTAVSRPQHAGCKHDSGMDNSANGKRVKLPVLTLDGRNRTMLFTESLARVIAAIRITRVRWRSYLLPEHRN